MPRHDTKNQLPLELAVMFYLRAPGDEIDEAVEGEGDDEE